MILTSNDDLLSLLRTFDEIFPDETVELKKEVRSFSNMAPEQNGKILEYNDLLIKIKGKQMESNTHKANGEMLEVMIRNKVNPEIPQIAQYMSAIYQEAEKSKNGGFHPWDLWNREYRLNILL